MRSYKKTILWCKGYCIKLVLVLHNQQISGSKTWAILVGVPNESLCEVPQRSVLGSLLFLIYVNDIYISCLKGKFHLFADNTCIFTSVKDLRDGFEYMPR